MREHWRAFLSASFIMLFLFSMSLFLTTVTAKASDRVKELIEVENPILSVTHKSKLPKHAPANVSMDTSIKSVSW